MCRGVAESCYNIVVFGTAEYTVANAVVVVGGEDTMFHCFQQVCRLLPRVGLMTGCPSSWSRWHVVARSLLVTWRRMLVRMALV